MAVGAGLALVGLVAVLIAWGPPGIWLEGVVGGWQNALAGRAVGGTLGGWRLYALAFAGGLVASLSPCILAMLPVNLAYIGAVRVQSRPAAVRVAVGFVLGVVAVNVTLGLVSSLFFTLFVQYRGPLNIAVGGLTVGMALAVFGILPLRLPQVARIPTGLGSFVVGLVFALVASPCASPILIAVLGAASLSASPLQAILPMTLYALGYTAVLFLASLSAGVAAASRRLLAWSELIARIAAVALLALGVGMVVYGVQQL